HAALPIWPSGKVPPVPSNSRQVPARSPTNLPLSTGGRDFCEHRGRRIGQSVSRPPGGGRRRPAGGSGGSGGPLGAQRRRQNHHFLHDRRAGAVRRGPHRTGRPGHHPPAHVPAGPAGDRVFGPGSVGVSPADGGGQYPGGAGGGGGAPGGAPGAPGTAAGGVSHRPRAPPVRLHPVGGRAPAHRDRPCLGSQPVLFAAGRALCRCGSHRRGRSAGGHQPAAEPGPGGAGHRSQRAGNPGHHRPGLHHARGPHPCGRRLGFGGPRSGGPQILPGRAVSAVSILGRYILRELAGPLLFGLLAFTSLFISVDLVQLVRMAVDYGASLTVVVQLIALRLPQVLVYTLPMAVLLAGILTLSRLSANSEIVAMQAGTVSLYRIVAPVIAVGAAATLVSLGFS